MLCSYRQQQTLHSFFGNAYKPTDLGDNGEGFGVFLEAYESCPEFHGHFSHHLTGDGVVILVLEIHTHHLGGHTGVPKHFLFSLAPVREEELEEPAIQFGGAIEGHATSLT